MFEHILVEQDAGIATLTLNRPEKMNAYTVDMGEEIVEAFARLADDDSVRVVILTGAGRGFCAGVDLEHLQAQASGAEGAGGRPRLGDERLVRELPLTLLHYPKPVIAAINGHAIGVGITMTLACDIRIAAEGAKIGFTFAKMGILPGLGSSYLLPRLVGPAKARELVLGAGMLLAPEAHAIGLVNQVSSSEELMPAARLLAADMAACDPRVLAAARALLADGEVAAVAAAMQRERAASAALRKA
tara:strand:- start:8184 stop:8918 length:735 start_codon:yes stop_codon:yes gene_type:complete